MYLESYTTTSQGVANLLLSPPSSLAHVQQRPRAPLHLCPSPPLHGLALYALPTRHTTYRHDQLP
jgi:hypothetical protein